MLLSNFNGFNSLSYPFEQRFMKRKDPHPGLPSGRKKIPSDSFTFLISCMVCVVVLVNLVLMLCLFVCLLLFFLFFFFFLLFFLIKKGEIFEKFKNCVYWYLYTLDGL